MTTLQIERARRYTPLYGAHPTAGRRTDTERPSEPTRPALPRALPSSAVADPEFPIAALESAEIELAAAAAVHLGRKAYAKSVFMELNGIVHVYANEHRVLVEEKAPMLPFSEHEAYDAPQPHSLLRVDRDCWPELLDLFADRLPPRPAGAADRNAERGLITAACRQLADASLAVVKCPESIEVRSTSAQTTVTGLTPRKWLPGSRRVTLWNSAGS